mgnify:CR=1 FL=1
MCRWTAAEKTAVVQHYVALPYGTRTAWLLERGVSHHQIMARREAFYVSDLERDLATERAAPARDAYARAEQVARLEASNEALGKTEGHRHESNAPQEPTREP